MKKNKLQRFNRYTYKKIMQNSDEKKDLIYYNIKYMMMDYNDNYMIG